ncbi:hypothetical protein HDU83_008974 [Entophlyctis luteolus]|nr:hypothetical protein HDU83_008974 [Entophlyctis luteolus]
MERTSQPSSSGGRPASAPRTRSSRAIRNRDAQRMYRQRQEEREGQLKQSVAAIARELRRHCDRFLLRCGDIDAEASNINDALNKLLSLDADGICADCLSEVTANIEYTHPRSADGRHGPLDVRQYTQALSNLFSLRGSELPREYMDSIRTFSKTGDPVVSRKCFVRMFGLRRKLLDKCSIVDRHMAIEILEQFKKDNKNHVATMYELMNTPDDLQREISNLSLNEDIDFQVGSETHMQSMLAALLKIDSLASRKELISELFLQLQRGGSFEENKFNNLALAGIKLASNTMSTHAAPPRSRTYRHAVPKVIRNRDAQRAYRQRQFDKLAQLQAATARLAADIRGAIACMNHKIRTIDAEIAASQDALAHLPSTVCASCEAAVFCHSKVRPPDPQSATALCGPPHLNQCLADLIKLPSLAGSFAAQKWVYAFADLCTFSDPIKVRKSFLYAVGLRRQLLDKCSVLDRPSAIEILQQMKDENRNHFDAMFETMYNHSGIQPDMPLVSNEFPFELAREGHLKAMRSAINRIESLAPHQDLVNELYGQLQLYTTEEREKAFFRVMDLQMRLQDLCVNDEERWKLMLALEIGKAF